MPKNKRSNSNPDDSGKKLQIQKRCLQILEEKESNMDDPTKEAFQLLALNLEENQDVIQAFEKITDMVIHPAISGGKANQAGNITKDDATKKAPVTIKEVGFFVHREMKKLQGKLEKCQAIMEEQFKMLGNENTSLTGTLKNSLEEEMKQIKMQLQTVVDKECTASTHQTPQVQAFCVTNQSGVTYASKLREAAVQKKVFSIQVTPNVDKFPISGARASDVHTQLVQKVDLNNLECDGKIVEKRGNAVYIHLQNEQDRRKHLDGIKKSELFTAKSLESKTPWIRVSNVSVGLNFQNFVESLIKHNFGKLGALTPADFSFVLKRKSFKGGKEHIVMRVSTRAWQAFGISDVTPELKLSSSWDQHIVREFEQTLQCYKCWKFGHIAKWCTTTEPEKCGTCSGEHKRDVCPNKDDVTKHKCINCVRVNEVNCARDPTGYQKILESHMASDKCCPSFIRAVINTKERIQYTNIGET